MIHRQCNDLPASWLDPGVEKKREREAVTTAGDRTAKDRSGLKVADDSHCRRKMFRKTFGAGQGHWKR